MEDIAIDADCNVYVTDHQNGGGSTVNRVQKFSSDGTFITSWGTPGNGNGQFFFPGPAGIAIDPNNGDVYVADTGNHRIQKFTSDGAFITTWGSVGSNDGQFSSPIGITVDTAGNVYVSDASSHRIQKFTSNGVFITKWGTGGSGNGQFNVPLDLATDQSNNVYVVDKQNNRIQKFDSTGGFITKWGSLGPNDGQFTFADIASGIIGITVVPSSGDVYVSDFGNHRIQMFDSDGTFLTKFSSVGSGNGQVDHPAGIALDQNDNIYVADSGNSRIQAFTGSIELPNRPPAAVSQTVSTNEDTPKSMHLNATDADNDPLTYSIESGPVAGGTLTGFNPNTGDVTYNPPLNFNDGGVGNEDQFTFKVNDGTADSTVEMIHMLVNPVNDAPIANDDQILYN